MGKGTMAKFTFKNFNQCISVKICVPISENMRVKICGITNSEDAQDAVELGADALGFVFTKSPRQIIKEQAGDIIRNLPPFVTTVGVFVDEKADVIKEICNFCGIHTVQLHGNEQPAYLNELEGYKIIKVFRIKEEDGLRPLANYKPHAFCWIVM